MFRPDYIVPILIVILQIYGLLTDQPSSYHVRLAFFSAGLASFYAVRYWYWLRKVREFKQELKKWEEFIAAYDRMTAPAGEPEGASDERVGEG